LKRLHFTLKKELKYFENDIKTTNLIDILIACQINVIGKIICGSRQRLKATSKAQNLE